MDLYSGHIVLGIILVIVGIALILPIFGRYGLLQMPFGFCVAAIGCTEILTFFVHVPRYVTLFIFVAFCGLAVLALFLVFRFSDKVYSSKKPKKK